jgi:hypothetical protein
MIHQNPKGPQSWYAKFARDMFDEEKYYGGRLTEMVKMETRTGSQENALRRILDKEFKGLTPKDHSGEVDQRVSDDVSKWYHRAASTVGSGALTALDWLQRGQYGSAKFFDILSQDGMLAFGKAMSAGVQEALDPKSRMSFTQIIKRENPGMPDLAAEVLGFIGDVVLDPTTYITFGGSSFAAKIAPKIIPKTGRFAGKTVSLTKKGESFFDKRLAAHAGDYERASESAAKAISMGLPVVHEQGKRGIYASFKLPYLKPLEARIPLPGIEKTNQYMKAFGEMKVGAWLQRSLLPIKKIPQSHIQDFVRQRDEILQSYTKQERTAIETFEEIWKGHDKDSLERMGHAGTRITEQTDMHVKALGGISDEAADDIRKDVFQKFNLNEKEQVALGRAMGVYQDLYRLEKEAGLTFEEIVNYHPRMYNLIRRGEVTQAYLREQVVKVINNEKLSKEERDKMVAEILGMEQTGQMVVGKHGSLRSRLAGFQKDREYDTLQQAIDDGFVPELDAAKMMSRRWTASVRARRDSELQRMFKGIEASGEYSKGELKILKRDLINVGMVSQKPFDSMAANMALGAWDGFLRVFRKGATIARPGFALRTMTDNLARNFLVRGVRGFGAFTPESQKAVWTVLAGMNQPGYEGLKHLRIRTPYGNQVDGAQMKEWFEQFDIATGRAMGVGKSFRHERNLERELMKVHKDLAYADVGDPIAKGKRAMLKQMGHYWNWSGMVEDWTRGSAFTNGIMLGLSPEAAAKMTNDIYFDYLNGLSDFENTIMKRIIPFYTFNRFIFPQLFKGFVKTPGRAAALKKTSEHFFSAVNKVFADENDTMTEAERFSLPGWLLEQPHTFLGFDKTEGNDMKAHFAAFNNFTPLDTMGFLEMDEGLGNKADIGRSVVKSFLSTVAPMIKIPFEIAMNRNLFTNRVIESTQYEVGSERLRMGENVAKPFEMFADIMPEWVQQAVGFEVVRDPRDGMTKAYVNPYAMHVAKSMIPALNDVVRVLDDRLTPRETAVSVLAGISQYKLNLKQQAEYRQVAIKKLMEEKEMELKRARKQGRTMSEEALWNELERFVLEATTEWQRLDLDKIRGTDLDPSVGGNSGMRGGIFGNPLKNRKFPIGPK